MFGERGGRLLIEASAGAGQGLDLWRAIALHEHCSRAPGGVVTRLAFTFEHHDTGLAGQAISQGGPRNTTADDGEIETFAVGHCEYLLSLGKGRHALSCVFIILR